MAGKTKGYFDFDMDIEEILLKNGMVEDLFYVKDLKQRKLYLTSVMSPSVANELAGNIMQFNADDNGIPVEERKPILLYINCVGGDAIAGFTIIDAIESSVTPVYTINTGMEYSMAFVVGLAGHKRIALRNSSFMTHDGSALVYDSGKKAEDRMKFNKRVDDRIRDFIIAHTNISSEEYNQNERVEWYMFAEEARQKGVCDLVIGVDCGIDEIV